MNDLFHKRKTIDGVKKLKSIHKSTIFVLEEAEKRNINWEKIPYTDLFKLDFEGKVAYFYGQIPSKTSAFAAYACRNKRVTKNILENEGISVSKGFLIKYSDAKKYYLKLFKNLNKPLVVKPVDDMQGNNVLLNIKTEDQYIKAINKIHQAYGDKKVDILVEQMFFGEEYRILTSREKVLSIIKRLPPNVIGDGKSSINDLIDKRNRNPVIDIVDTYKKIKINDDIEDFLKDQSLDLDSVLEKGKQVFLKKHSSLDISSGGDTVDVTDKVHPSVKEIALKIMESIPGLALSGIDFMTKDIYKEQGSDDYRVIEVNSSPSLDWNQYPIVGSKREIAFEFLKIMFPELKR